MKQFQQQHWLAGMQTQLDLCRLKLSALVHEVNCLERSKQLAKWCRICQLTTWLASSAQSSSKQIVLNVTFNDCLATWSELHRPVCAAQNIRSSEHFWCICQIDWRNNFRPVYINLLYCALLLCSITNAFNINFAMQLEWWHRHDVVMCFSWD